MEGPGRHHHLRTRLPQGLHFWYCSLYPQCRREATPLRMRTILAAITSKTKSFALDEDRGRPTRHNSNAKIITPT